MDKMDPLLLILRRIFGFLALNCITAAPVAAFNLSWAFGGVDIWCVIETYYENGNGNRVLTSPKVFSIIPKRSHLPKHSLTLKGLPHFSDIKVQPLNCTRGQKTYPGHARSHQNFVVSLPIPYKNLSWFTVPHDFFLMCPIYSRSHRIFVSPVRLSQQTNLIPSDHCNFVPGSPVRPTV